jgi:hypothetical protein
MRGVKDALKLAWSRGVLGVLWVCTAGLVLLGVAIAGIMLGGAVAALVVVGRRLLGLPL